jgi:hypothetical protein
VIVIVIETHWWPMSLWISCVSLMLAETKEQGKRISAHHEWIKTSWMTEHAR